MLSLYQWFAVAWSTVDVILLTAAVVIAFRRARFQGRRHGDRREPIVAAHARFIEGPSAALALMFALAAFAAALLIGRDEYAPLAAGVIAFGRGLLLPIAVSYLWFFRREKETWR